MIKKRLLEIVPESKKYIAENVVFQWMGMCCNIVMVFTIAHILNDLINGREIQYGMRFAVILITVFLRILCIKLASNASFEASKSVKLTLRSMICQLPTVQGRMGL